VCNSDSSRLCQPAPSNRASDDEPAHVQIHSLKQLCETMKTKTQPKSHTTVAARIAGEDIKRGDYVTVLNDIFELPSFLWCCSSSTLPPDEPVRSRYMAREAGQPFKVIAVCLPFVYAKRPPGKLHTIDTRRQQLVRLDPESGRCVWKRMRKMLKSKHK
jgi:hypothetical protein